jgi:class 3 adenylate cyclase
MNLSSQRYPEERRLATVLFADVQGFTALAEQLDFETVSDLIKDIWGGVDGIIVAHGGYIDKHIGDAVMAVWGAPQAADNDAENAILAGLALLESLEEYVRTTSIQGANTLKMRVGINTGLVFAGYVGIKDEYTVIGDTVNVANRLETAAHPGKVLISENTLQMVHGNFRVAPMEPIFVKGKREALKTYEVESHQQVSGRTRYQSANSLSTHMVGRESELQRLQTLFGQMRESSSPVMTIVTGEVGIGKSRLLMEFSNTLEESETQAASISTRALAQASRVPFYLWRALLRTRFGLNNLPADEMASSFLDQMRAIWHGDNAEEAAHLIGYLIGLNYPESPHLASASGNPDTRLQRTFFFMRQLMGILFREEPGVLFFDDLQWADRESLHLLMDMLQPGVEPLPLFIIGGARPEFLRQHPQWRNLAYTLELNAIPFNAEQVAKAYPDLENLSPTVLEELATRAEGNPFFLEEIVKTVLKKSAEQFMETQEEQITRALKQVPESLRATLQARLDNLSREARSVALLASIVGRVFWVGAVLAQLRAKPAPGVTPLITIPEPVIERFVQDGLRQLVRAELAFPRAGTHFSEQQEYIFKNSFLRDVAYSLLPNRSHSHYHLAVAEWLAQQNDPSLRVMAHDHYKHGGQPAPQNLPAELAEEE